MNLHSLVKPNTRKKVGAMLRAKSRGNGHLLENVTLSFGGKTVHLDYLWLSSFGILAVMTSDACGELFVEPKGEDWLMEDLKKVRSRTPNLLAELEGFKEMLARLLPKENLYRIDVTTAVVFGRKSSKGLSIYSPPKLPLLRIDAFGKMLKLPKFGPGGTGDADKLLAGIEKYRV